MDAKELGRSTQALGNRYLEEYTRSLQRYAALFSDAAKRGGVQSGTAQDAVEKAIELQKRYAEFVAAEAPQFLGRIAEAGITYYTVLANTGLEVIDRYYEQVLKTGTSDTETDDPTPGSASDAPTRSSLVFHGVRGESATNAFLVSNNRNEPIDVTFDVAEVVSDDGATRFKPKVSFAPKKCKLAPQARQVVQCSVQLSDKFASGRMYKGSIQVVGFPEMAMAISVQVEEPPNVPVEKPATAGSVNSPARKAPAKKKTRVRKSPG